MSIHRKAVDNPTLGGNDFDAGGGGGGGIQLLRSFLIGHEWIAEGGVGSVSEEGSDDWISIGGGSGCGTCTTAEDIKSSTSATERCKYDGQILCGFKADSSVLYESLTIGDEDIVMNGNRLLQTLRKSFEVTIL